MECCAVQAPDERIRTTTSPKAGRCSFDLSDAQQTPLGADPARPPLEDRLGAAPAVMRLTRFQRRWPIGAVGDDEFHFCAEPAQPGLLLRYCAKRFSQAVSRRSAAMAAV